jgi:hypothetical protein
VRRFLVLYLSSASAGQQMASATPEQAKASMDAWTGWMQAAGSTVVEPGAPLAYSLTVPAGTAPRAGLNIGGYAIMEADSAEALRGKLAGHPHFMAPDAAIEVHEMLTMPGM